MTRYIGIISGKGGVGKTTTSINLAAGINFFKKKAIVVDSNISTPNIGIHLGVPNVPVSLHHVLQGKDKMKDALYEHYSGMNFVPASLALNDMINTKPNTLKKAVPKLKGKADIVLVDCAAGLGGEALAAIEAVNEFLIVTNPEKPAVTDALKTVKLLEQMKKKVLGVVVTRYRESELDLSLKSIEGLLEKRILAVVPEDWSVRKAMVRGDAVVHTHPKSESAIAYKNLAAKLLRKKYKEEYKESLFRRLLSFFRK